MCKTNTDGKTDAEIEAIWTDWRKKGSVKKITEAYAEIVLRVEDLQLVHMCSKSIPAVPFLHHSPLDHNSCQGM